MHRTFLIVSTVAVIAVIAYGFVLVGSPGSRRLDRFDEQRVQDLQAIVQEIQSMVIDSNSEKRDTLKAPLPTTLEEAAMRAKLRGLSLNDPETGVPYEYRVKSETTYELCATFAGARSNDYRVFWNHPAGAHCFTINVLDPPP